VQKQKIYIIY